ncbi:MAG TPA: prolyl oligopeptidase family serine peptidase, partial [Gemmatimonadaceae bacterium]|nr:prolyl oligopeptidase family serine peptidase [Gemmatimonadaceae bacterium]
MLRHVCALSSGAIAFLLLLPVDAAAAAQPPRAHRGLWADTVHGIRIEDPYRWLEQMGSAETQAWTRAQDAYARTYASAVPERSVIHRRLTAIASVERFGAPVARGTRLFYTQFASTGPATRSSLIVEDGGNRRVMIAGDSTERATGRVPSRFFPSPDGRLVAYTLRRAGTRWETLRVREVESGRDLTDSLVGINGASSVQWDPDARGLSYVRYPVPPAGEERQTQLRDGKLYRHRLGAPQSSDSLLFELPTEPFALLRHRVSDDGRFTVVNALLPTQTANRIWAADARAPGRGFVPVMDEGDAAYWYVGSRGSTLWLVTNHSAPRWRVIGVNVTDPAPSRWREVIPQAAEAIDLTGPGITMVNDRFIVAYVADARSRIRTFDTTGRFEREIALPYLGSVWTGFVGRQQDREAFYVLSGVADPGTIFRLDVASGTSREYRRPSLPYDPSNFVTRQVFYTSRDGTRVPMYVVHRKGLALDGTAPAYMYGYGHGGWSAAPWFQANIAVWLENGGVWALPNTRGGGEYGEEWHQAGIRRNKQNAIDDYIAAAEWLIANRYTSRERFVANTSSAGGPLVAAAIIQRPELFGAAVIDYPLM